MLFPTRLRVSERRLVIALSPSRRAVQRRSLILAAIAVAGALAAMSTGVVLSRNASKRQIVTNLKARATSSAGFLSAFIAQQAAHQHVSNERFLGSAAPASSDFWSILPIFVDHASTLKSHQVLLVDGTGGVIASSPDTRAATLASADPALARAIAHASSGAVAIAGVPSTFVTAPVPGTPWRLVMAAPNSRAFASIGGATKWLPWIVVALVALLGVAVVSLLLRSQMERARLAALSRELAQAASTDTLTGLANRRSLQEQLAHASAYANRYSEPLSVLMIDLDHFKEVNDTHGHEAGDMVLSAVAETMTCVFRDSDIFGRWGGDEFLAVLPNTDSHGALEAGQRLCASVSEIDVSKYGLAERLTLSVGCASAVNTNPHDLINEADNSLFRAKRDGRSRANVG